MLPCAHIDTPDSGSLVGERELARTLAWGEFLRTHAMRIYESATQPETTGAKTILKKEGANSSNILSLTTIPTVVMGIKGLTNCAAVCTVITAPKKKEMIITMGKDPKPISIHCLIYSFQNIFLFSADVNIPFNIKR